jgi:hypothetical protein
MDESVEVISVSILTCTAMPVIKHHSSVSASAQQATENKSHQQDMHWTIDCFSTATQRQLQTETTPFWHGF